MSDLSFTGPDRRDQRDPLSLGNILLRARDGYERAGMGFERLSEVADYAAGTLVDHVPDYRDARP